MVEFFAMLLLSIIGAACITNSIFAFCIHDEIKELKEKFKEVK